MFTGELAAVVQPGEHRDQIPGNLVAASEQASAPPLSSPPDVSQP
jgi:hypothetical protein